MLNPKYLLIVSLLFFKTYSFAQNELQELAYKLEKIEEDQEKIDYIEKIIEEASFIDTTHEAGTLYQELSKCYKNTDEFDKAFFYLQKAINIREKQQDVALLNESRYELFKLYDVFHKKEEAYKVLLKIINDLGNDIYTSYAHRRLGIIESRNGDYYKAIEYLNLGLANEALCENPEYESYMAAQIIQVYSEKSLDVSAKNTTNNDLEIVKKHYATIEKNAKEKSWTLPTAGLIATHSSIANVFESFGDHKSALQYYEKSKKIAKREKNLEYELSNVLNMGLIYSKQGKHKLANNCYDRVLNTSQDDYRISLALDNKGYYLPNTPAKEKLKFFEKAIYMLLEKNNQEKDTTFEMPTLLEIKESGYEQEIITYLIDLASHYIKVYEEEKDTSYLPEAKKAAHLIDNLVSLIRYESSSEQSKLFWIEKGVNIYMLAVKACYILNHVDDAFYFMEKNKSLLLQENIKTLQAKLALDIPQEILEKEHRLNYELQVIKEQFEVDKKNKQLNDDYVLKSREYRSYMDSIATVYAKYTKTKEDVEIISLNEVVQEFDARNEYFVEYILHETEGYGIFYDGTKPQFFKISGVVQFQEELKTVKAYMTKRVLSTKETETYKKVAFQVFNTVFPGKELQSKMVDKKIVIVPDNSLLQLPFEALVTNNEGNLEAHYLIQQTEISYLQSFSLYHQIKEKVNTPSQKLLVIAPKEFSDPALPALAEVTNTVKDLSDYESSSILFEEEATKTNFLKERNKYEIIHFNTHAGVDEKSQTPWISFREEKMTLRDLLGLENQADLVILDACKTNDGAVFSGEGIMNLSRGFFYNGTQSVLASLWNVNENTGNKIIQRFYSHLETGHSKSKALQLAKKEFLNNQDFAQTAPYYWAAFTLTGSTSAIDLPVKTNYTWYLIIGGLVFLGLLYFIVKKNKNKS